MTVSETRIDSHRWNELGCDSESEWENLLADWQFFLASESTLKEPKGAPFSHWRQCVFAKTARRLPVSVKASADVAWEHSRQHLLIADVISFSRTSIADDNALRNSNCWPLSNGQSRIEQSTIQDTHTSPLLRVDCATRKWSAATEYFLSSFTH